MTPELPAPDLGRRLSGARIRRGVSQGTVARRAGIAPSYLSRIETGKIHPGFEIVLRIVWALRCDLHEIVDLPAGADGSLGACPVSRTGRCLLDLVRPDSAVGRRRRGDPSYTPRELKLLRRFAAWIEKATPDRLRAMEVLLDDLVRGQPPGH